MLLYLQSLLWVLLLCHASYGVVINKPTKAPTFVPTAVPTIVPSFRPSARPTTAHSSADPILLSYVLDCGIGKLTLSFDIEVSAKTMDISGLFLQSVKNVTATPSYSTFTFNSTYNNLVSQGNTTDLVIYISSVDFAKLKLASPIARSDTTTYLTMYRDTIASPFGRYNKEVSTFDAMAASELILDTFPPYLVTFTLIMDTGLMTMTFSEPINVSTFTLDGLTVQGSSYLGDAVTDPEVAQRTINLIDYGASLVSTSNMNRKIVYQLGTRNLNRIKTRIGLATSIESTYLSAFKPFVNDLSG
jgi:hypothetical protein